MAGLDPRRRLFRSSRQPPLSGRRLHPSRARTRLSLRAGRLPRRLRPCAAARRSGLCAISGSLWQGRPARAAAGAARTISRGSTGIRSSSALIATPARACASSAPASSRRRRRASFRWKIRRPIASRSISSASCSTKYIINDFQQTYFVVESFEQLLAGMLSGFRRALRRSASCSPTLRRMSFAPGDRVIAKGDRIISAPRDWLRNHSGRFDRSARWRRRSNGDPCPAFRCAPISPAFRKGVRGFASEKHLDRSLLGDATIAEAALRDRQTRSAVRRAIGNRARADDRAGRQRSRARGMGDELARNRKSCRRPRPDDRAARH